MGTRNFYTKDAKNTYALIPNLSDENIEQDIDYINEVFYEFEIEDIKINIINKLKEKLNKINVKIKEENEWDNNRNFNGRIFGIISFDKEYKGDDKNPYPAPYYEIYIKLIIRNGYYEGCNLDYEINLYNGGMGDELEFNELPKLMQNKLNKIINIIEEIYKNNSEGINLI